MPDGSKVDHELSSDWRLRDDQRFLAGARVRRLEYRASPSWDHDHCAFCWQKLGEAPMPNSMNVGWLTEDESVWICDVCFEDFRARFGFVVIDASTAMRGVELHDARVVEIVEHGGVTTLSLRAFVHDEWESESCAGAWQRVDLVMRGATVERNESGAPRVLEGSVRVDGEVFDNMLPIPFRKQDSAVAIELTGADYRVAASARSVWLRVAGPSEGR